MFKLQRLEITGFKSFADHTEIVFTGDGITAVVGPNGCGKSNVADAIAWVLGEQRVKQLRGAEMKDVIFQGSRNRQPSGMAEVVLHMVRDETIEHEADIDDIDSTLEGIDEQSIEVEGKLAVELNEEGQTVSSLSTSEAGALAQTESGEAIPASNAVAGEAATEAASLPAEVVAGDSTIEATNDSALQPSSESTKLHHAKRHWRPSRLALEFAPGESVTVTRRLYRSGESEYLLNGRMCRLRDIHDLFAGTGLSGAHYAIIEQGRIGQMLSAKPMDRRTIIEEAAGISKFRVRQRAAEARLDSAKSNLSRVSDIISEIERQVGSLRRQAAKARRYRHLREELRELLRRVYVAEERTLSSLLEETRIRVEDVAREEQALVESLASLEESARRATQEARDLEDALAEARAFAAEAALQRDRRLRERTYQEEQVVASEGRRERVEREMESVAERLVGVEDECARLRQAEETLRAESEMSAQQLQTAEAAYSRKLVEATEAEEAIELARAELLTHTAASERLREIGRQLESALEKVNAQAEGLLREGERATGFHQERIVEAEQLGEEIAAARRLLAQLTTERIGAVEKVIQGHERVSDTDAELARVREEYSRVRHRLDTLKELDEKRAYYSPAVQQLFSTNDQPVDFQFVGTLADMVRVEPRWERAVEGVFGTALQSIIVPTPDDASRAAHWLRETGAGRASLLVVGLHGASEELDEAIYRPLMRTAGNSQNFSEIPENARVGDLLNAPPELLSVLRRTMPQQMNARLVRNLDDAIALSLSTGDMCVTVNGDWVAGGQLVGAGDARTVEEGAGLLAFKRELRELDIRANELEVEMNVAEQAVGKARSELTELEDAVVLLNEAIGREERDAMARELSAQQLAQEIERAARHMRVVTDDAARLEQERLELEERRGKALVEAEAAETARAAAALAVTGAAALVTIARKQAEAENEGLSEQRASAAAAGERRRAVSAELRRMEAERDDLSARLESYARESREIETKLEELRGSISELERRAAGVEEEREQEEQDVAEASRRLSDAREKADALADKLSQLNHSAAEARERRAELDVQRAEATARLSFVREACMNELNQPLEELARERAVDEEFDLEAGRARVEELRARVEGFGAVNMMALEELSESEERHLFLTGQRQDILDGISSTEEALREIKRRSRERFRHAFEQINRNFGALFQELFGGGRGEMTLIDADDILESGIDLIAQPPGKRLQNVLLLSGGEKAMAALALVLGIFHYRPSPFCLLDEVDAPLDEANVGRFVEKVREMAASTQFIVITHNKRTMEMARALYGVTMEEVGVSKLVSVKFE